MREKQWNRKSEREQRGGVKDYKEREKNGVEWGIV